MPSTSTLVDARALWWEEDAPDGPYWMALLSATINGASYLSDQRLLLPVSAIGGLPVGWGNVLIPMGPQAVDGFAEWLNATPCPDSSPLLFHGAALDAIEAAGLRVRPLQQVKSVHGICDAELGLVGLIMPVRPGAGLAGARAAIR